MNGAAGTNPKGNTMRYFRTVAGTLVLAVIVALALSATAAGAADSTTTGYSDGVTYQGELDWSAPSNLYLAENGDACIDPPVWVWLTLHVEVNGVESADLTQVFPYEHNEPGYVCVPFPLPECVDATQDITWAAYGTWNIGTGRSNEIGGTIDCTPEVPPTPEVPVPTELAPPAPPVVQTAVPVEGDPTLAGALPVTGSEELALLTVLGLALIAIGWTVSRNWDTKNVRGLR